MYVRSIRIRRYVRMYRTSGAGATPRLGLREELGLRAHPCDNLPNIVCVCAIPYVIIIAPTRDSHHCLLQCPG